MDPTPGRIVLLKVKAPEGYLPEVEQIPMLITHVHSVGCVSGVVFSAFAGRQSPSFVYEAGVTVRTSVNEGEDIGQWSWPVRA